MKEIRLGLVDCTSKTKLPVLQVTCLGILKVWTSYNQTLTEGTYYYQSSIDLGLRRVVISKDGIPTITKIK